MGALDGLLDQVKQAISTHGGDSSKLAAFNAADVATDRADYPQ